MISLAGHVAAVNLHLFGYDEALVLDWLAQRGEVTHCFNQTFGHHCWWFASPVLWHVPVSLYVLEGRLVYQGLC